jgi:hypothetical protein
MIQPRTVNGTLLLLSLLLIDGCSGNITALPNGNGGPGVAPSPNPPAFAFKTLSDIRYDATYCLGIDNDGAIAGSVVKQKTTKGLQVVPPYGSRDYRMDPARTVVLGFHGKRDAYGYQTDSTGIVWGYERRHGLSVFFRQDMALHTEITGLYGVDGSIGFYENANGGDTAYVIVGRHSHHLTPPNSVSAAAMGVNDKGTVVGWAQSAAGRTTGWVRQHATFTTLQFPQATSTQAFGINSKDDVVGTYTAQDGTSHGFIAVSPYQPGDWQTIDNPRTATSGATVVTGINDRRAIVGWYVDSHGRTDGFLATPR